MGFFDDRGNLGPPPEVFRFGRRRRPTQVNIRWIGLAAAVAALFIAVETLKSVYVDLLWFDASGFGGVFRTMVKWEVSLFILGALVAGSVIGVNVMLARRLAPRGIEESFLDEIDPAAIHRITTILLAVGTVLLALLFAAAAAAGWEHIASWRAAVPFGRTDPQFGRDFSFYAFTLPAYASIRAWLVGLVVVSGIASGAVYALVMSLQRFEVPMTRGMRVHLSVLAAAFLVLMAVGHYLSTFALVTGTDGIVAGATYADVHARLPMLYLLAGLALFAAAGSVANAFLTTQGFRLPAFVIGLWVFGNIVGGALYPATIQRFTVEPNERQREEPYIARNIEATRYAFGLDQIEESQYPAAQSVSAAEIDANPATMRNIRLLDPIPLLDTFNQIQAIRQFYTFRDVDVDRYTINGELRQVMLAPRELDVSKAQNRNWTRERLQLTHGFGAVVSPVNEVREEGLPVLLTADIPPKSAVLPLDLDGSRIYFGEVTNQYVVVNSSEAEFDYPVGEANAETKYAEDRGIRLDSFAKRLALAWQLGDQNLLISERITSDSRLLMRRNITDRVSHVAPFLRLDSDPYAVVQDGGIIWIQSAYTTSADLPYAQPMGDVNYIRPSVTVTVNAVTGDMTFYLQDPTDPVAATWAKIFPALFTPVEQMPADVRAHLRYPLDLFKMQSQMYLRYHITSPDVFFIGEDVWNVPTERFLDREQAVEPYYVVMALPDNSGKAATHTEFALIMPFTPRNRQNTVAWLAGRSDGEHYGTLRGYRFPTEALVFGPAQIEARIDQNPAISEQLTLWNQAGSQVIRGNLLMIPVGSSFLFVEPIYLQAENSRLPELVRVVVANGNSIAMERTLPEAVDVVLGRRTASSPGAQPSPSPSGGTAAPRPTATPAAGTAPAATGTIEQLLQEAQRSSQTTQAELDRLRGLLDAIQKQLEQPRPPTATPTPTPAR